jgi:hypothetical protein
MSLILANRVRETTTITGTGAITLAGAVVGYQPFSIIGNGNITYYCIADQSGANWETGIGTYSSSGNTLARTTVLSSSNAGSLVSFTGGTQDVFLTYPSEVSVLKNTDVSFQAITGTSITDSGLTSGRITYAGAGGLLKDSANLTYDGSAYQTLTTQTYVNGGIINARTAPSGGTYNTYDFVEGSTTTSFLRNFGSVYGSGLNNSLAIYTTQSGPIIFGTNNAEAARIHASGGVSIGNTTDPGAGNLLVNNLGLFGTTSQVAAIGNSGQTKLNAYGNGLAVNNGTSSAVFGGPNGNEGIWFTGGAFRVFNASVVGVYLLNGGTAWVPASSDERLKNKVSSITNALDAINKLDPLSYYYKNEAQTGKPRYGHFAQDIGAAIPDAMLISMQPDPTLGETYTYDPDVVNVYLVAALKELSAKFDAYVASHP